MIPQVTGNKIINFKVRGLICVTKECGRNDMVGRILYPVFGDFQPSSGWMDCEGQLLSIEHHPDLFAQIGYAYGNAPTMETDTPISRIEAFLRKHLTFGTMKPRAKMLVPNPDHKPGFFRLPDFRYQIVL